jgi:hypothetical protein
MGPTTAPAIQAFELPLAAGAGVVDALGVEDESDVELGEDAGVELETDDSGVELVDAIGISH